MKKLLVIGVIVLFLGVSVIPLSGTTDVKQITMPIARGDTLYVGGNGTGNYSKIQDAINDSSNGDTVFVYDDSSPYYENVVVDKSISLIGEDRNTTVIDAGRVGDVIFISANGVTITGFTIQNGGKNNGFPDNVDAGIEIRSNYNIIIGNIITKNYRGAYLTHAARNNITTNIITNNTETGIDVGDWARHNHIFGNVIEDTIGEYGGCGIVLYGAFHITILLNTIQNNTRGIGITESKFDIISKNHITNNREYGIHIIGAFTFFNFVRENNFIENECNALFGNILFPTLTSWFSNYWDDWRGFGPYRITGTIFLPDPSDPLGWIFIPWLNFDWHPAKEPYDIGV